MSHFAFAKFALLNNGELVGDKHLLLTVMIGSQIGGMNAKQDCASCVIETVPFQQRPY